MAIQQLEQLDQGPRRIGLATLVAREGIDLPLEQTVPFAEAVLVFHLKTRAIFRTAMPLVVKPGSRHVGMA